MMPRDLFGSGQDQSNIDRLKVRLAVLGVLVIAAFVALFSRLWFLQVLAADEFEQLAQENRVRTIYSEPPRGRILDRNGYVLVDNRPSRTVTVDREIVETPVKKRAVFRRLSNLLDISVRDLNNRLLDVTVSPYKPVAVASDVKLKAVAKILENPENFEGVHIETRPVRFYPQGQWAAQVLGYVGEITGEQFDEPYFKKARPPYQPGDIVGRSGLERYYDKQLRGLPRIEQVVVNSSNKVVDSRLVQEAEPGRDLITTIDIRIQKAAEQALASAIEAHQASYDPEDAGVVVLDPDDGSVRAMASHPTYDPSILADGFQTKDEIELGVRTDTNADDKLVNRTTQTPTQPGSTFKVPVALAAIALGVADVDEVIECPGYVELGLNDQIFRNWTSAHNGYIGFAESLEISCDTFYYELGWRMEDLWGAGNGDGSERFQKMLRRLGFDDPTGVDLPGEQGGTIADEAWLDEFCEAIDGPAGCTDWQPGYTVNMSIGQQDIAVTPLQMAMNYSAVVNGGKLIRPHLADYFGRPAGQVIPGDEVIASPDPLSEATPTPSPSASVSPAASATPSPSPTPIPSPSGHSTELTGQEARTDLSKEIVVRRVKPKTIRRLPVGPEVLEVLQEGLEDVVMGDAGTATSAFAGFPLDRYQIAGKTGTAEIGETGENRAWFVSYAPVDDPEYVIAVYMNNAGHGGTSAAPIAREIYEAIFDLDSSTDDFSFGSDASG
jgi:penicillin-binding protein 2